MKKEELLKEINKLPNGTDICVFDYMMNTEGDSDGEDGYFEGIYHDFEVGLMGKDDVMPKEKRWAYISFTNPDYKEDGKVKLMERDIKEYEENGEDELENKLKENNIIMNTYYTIQSRTQDEGWGDYTVDLDNLETAKKHLKNLNKKKKNDPAFNMMFRIIKVECDFRKITVL